MARISTKKTFSVELHCNCGTEQTSWTHQERQQAGEDPIRLEQIGRSMPGAIHDQELVFEEKRLSNDGTDTPGPSK